MLYIYCNTQTERKKEKWGWPLNKRRHRKALHRSREVLRLDEPFVWLAETVAKNNYRVARQLVATGTEVRLFDWDCLFSREKFIDVLMMMTTIMWQFHFLCLCNWYWIESFSCAFEIELIDLKYYILNYINYIVNIELINTF